ncbi:hypothetical protein KZC52_14070 [Microbacterium sp. kSW2-24]|uniref:hypothetical protein n=1 Tax=Microbacterium galbinum TaxID=2851646 RepID=UPI001FFD54B2|nr:hypothetical protein [Microbacterium galbinum]MCK2024061.1 hypothetical protein [Microbacterium galbinum]
MPVERTNNFGAITQQILANARMGVGLAGERLLALSAAEVPLDQGTLMGSGAVSTPLGGEGIEAQVTYDTPYAARLHEHPEYNFQDGRKGKYLEDPALEHKDELLAIIAKEAGRG